MRRQNLGPHGRLHTGIRLYVLQDVAGALDIHRRQAEQKGEGTMTAAAAAVLGQRWRRPVRCVASGTLA